MEIGVRLPTSGPGATRSELLDRGLALEAAGFAGLWVSDHVVQPALIRSTYPYSDDGTAAWDPTIPQLEAVTALAALAAVTTRARLGTAVLVLPQRQPVLLAKQLATLSVIAGPRLVLGAGAGWLEEEFQALGVPFADRGARFDEWIDALRECWTGRPAAVRSERLDLSAGLVVEPRPVAPIPVLVGGMSGVAVRRAVTRGDGWIAQADLAPAGVATVCAVIERLRAACEKAGRDPGTLRLVARLSGDAGAPLADLLRPLRDAGVAEVIVDAPPRGDEVVAAERWHAAAE